MTPRKAKPKLGRPPRNKSGPAAKQVAVRLSDGEMLLLEIDSAKHGMGRGDFLRWLWKEWRGEKP